MNPPFLFVLIAALILFSALSNAANDKNARAGPLQDNPQAAAQGASRHDLTGNAPPSIDDRGLFGGSGEPAGEAAGRKSAYRLVGTIQSRHFAGAVLDDTAGDQTFYRIGETMPDGSRIVKVQSDHILLQWPDGSRSELFTAAGAGGPVSVEQPRREASRVAGDEVRAQRREKTEMMRHKRSKPRRKSSPNRN